MDIDILTEAEFDTIIEALDALPRKSLYEGVIKAAMLMVTGAPPDALRRKMEDLRVSSIKSDKMLEESLMILKGKIVTLKHKVQQDNAVKEFKDIK